MWSPENDMKENIMGNTWHASNKSILHILLKSRTRNYHTASWRKRMRGLEVCPITLLKLQQKLGNLDWKRWPNNFAQATTILGNLYWKHCLLIKNVDEIHEIEVFLGSNLNFTIRIFTWGLANYDNIYKKIFCSVWSIMQ